MNKEKNNICEHCGQTIYTLSSLNKGTMRLLSQIFKFVEQKDMNVFHPSKELLAQGYIDSNMRNNVNHLANHGLVAPMSDKPGNWVITRKAGLFMKGQKYPRIAVINKATKHTEFYEGEMVSYRDILQSSDEYWYQPGIEITRGEEITRTNTQERLF